MPAPPPPVIHAQNPVSVDSQEIDVEPSQSNEEFIDYLELTDYFVMSAERIPTSKWYTPANVSVISADEIEKNHYSTVAEALSHVNGVVVTQLGRMDTSGFVSINGSNRVLLLIDGHRANVNQDAYVGVGIYAAQQSGLCDLSLIPSIKIIDRIEVVKGGASALYGADAVGGIINIITKKGQRNETTVDVNYGSWSRYNLETTNQGVKGKLSWFVTAGLGGSDKYKHPGVGYTYHDYADYEDQDFSIRLDDQFSERNSLSISYMHKSHEFANSYYWGLLASYGYSLGKQYTLYNSSSIEYKFKEDTSTPGWIRYFNNYQKGYNCGTDFYYGNSKVQGAEYQNGWELGDHHKLIVGVEWHRAEAECSAKNYDEKIDTIASYVQDTISLGNKWTLIPGIRYDHDSQGYGSNWSPKIAANYRPDDKTKFYASWGKTYSIPTIGELYSYFDGYTDGSSPSVWQLGGAYQYLVGLLRSYAGVRNEWGTYSQAELKPETGYSATVGMEHDFDDSTSASLSFFQNKLKNGVAWDRFPVDDWNQEIWYVMNDLIQKNRGLELTFKQNVSDRWSYDLGYSHTKVDNGSATGISWNMYYGQPNGYRVGVHYNVGKWRANLLGVMASGLATPRFASKSYAVLDFNTSYDFTDRTSVYFRTLNFTDEDYSNDYARGTAPGRFIQIGATYKF